MKVNELRIGNYIRFFNMIKPAEHIKVTARFFSMLANGRPESELKDDDELTGYYSGIPLTPEILDKCGFEKGKEGFWMLNGVEYNPNKLILDGFGHCEVKYLHQLQNLFYALTGEELGIIF